MVNLMDEMMVNMLGEVMVNMINDIMIHIGWQITVNLVIFDCNLCYYLIKLKTAQVLGSKLDLLDSKMAEIFQPKPQILDGSHPSTHGCISGFQSNMTSC